MFTNWYMYTTLVLLTLKTRALFYQAQVFLLSQNFQKCFKAISRFTRPISGIFVLILIDFPLLISNTVMTFLKFDIFVNISWNVWHVVCSRLPRGEISYDITMGNVTMSIRRKWADYRSKISHNFEKCQNYWTPLPNLG